ncbi:hypothetical protein JHL17_20890 [Azospirillum sp. YIM B02556]|uniref:Uncharacterized protein n=1 Tax=Azospirillum endophyticum TaxID=2800326 RepID=A0ABS1F8Y7_9PROT|nr:hypothetical protein [Azospirillum endophyticum]MBK1839869.1 hypothetical protein [Azospirillum endophyticum]
MSTDGTTAQAGSVPSAMRVAERLRRRTTAFTLDRKMPDRKVRCAAQSA